LSKVSKVTHIGIGAPTLLENRIEAHTELSTGLENNRRKGVAHAAELGKRPVQRSTEP
jgi:hypothetical protein